MLAMWIGWRVVVRCTGRQATGLFGSLIADGDGGSGVALADWATKLAETQFFLITSRVVCLCLLKFLGALILVHRPRRGSESRGASTCIVLIVLALMSIWSGLAHWQRAARPPVWLLVRPRHATPPGTEDDSLIYPEMSENAILFGGTDPGGSIPRT